MFLRYEELGDPVLRYIPNQTGWEIRDSDERGYEDGGLYPVVEGRKTQLRDIDYWCMGRPKLPETEVADLYKEMVESVAERIAKNPDLHLIDIDEVEQQLIASKYEARWLEKGYVQVEHGGW